MPFGRDPAPSMLHRHTAHNEAVARIGWCVAERRIGVITGEVGAGKTVAVRARTRRPGPQPPHRHLPARPHRRSARYPPPHRRLPRWATADPSRHRREIGTRAGRRAGSNVQIVADAGGFPVWSSEVEPGSVHDITAAPAHCLGALYKTAADGLPTLADKSYQGNHPLRDFRALGLANIAGRLGHRRRRGMLGHDRPTRPNTPDPA